MSSDGESSDIFRDTATPYAPGSKVNHHTERTVRDKVVSAVPIFRLIRYIWNHAPYWLRRKGKVKHTKEEGSGLTTHEFVDASHSSWAVRFCSIYVLVYLFLSIVAYSFLFERWSIIDSLYFAATTFTSCGYGDLVPSSNSGKIFTVFFALYGISILGIALGIIGRNVVEAEGHAIAVARDKGVKRIMETFAPHEKKRNNTELSDLNSTTSNAENATRVAGDATIADKGHNISEAVIPCIYGVYQHLPQPSLLSTSKDLLLTQSPNIIFIVLLAMFIGRREGWTPLNSLYYCFITVTTVGLGDVSPASQAMRLFAVFFIPLSVAVLGELVGRIAGYLVNRASHEAERSFMAREMTLTDLEVMDADNDGDVTEAEFMSFMLVAMQKVDRELIIELRELFAKLDAQGNGVLQKKDLEILAQRKRIRERMLGSTVRR